MGLFIPKMRIGDRDIIRSFGMGLIDFSTPMGYLEYTERTIITAMQEAKSKGKQDGGSGFDYVNKIFGKLNSVVKMAMSSKEDYEVFDKRLRGVSGIITDIPEKPYLWFTRGLGDCIVMVEEDTNTNDFEYFLYCDEGENFPLSAMKEQFSNIRLKCNKDLKNPRVSSDLRVDIELVHCFNYLVNALEYFLNSYSYREYGFGNLEPFDSIELDRYIHLADSCFENRVNMSLEGFVV